MTSRKSDQINETTVFVPVSVLNFLEPARKKIAAGGLRKPEHDLLGALLDFSSHVRDSDLPSHEAHVQVLLEHLGSFMSDKSMPGSSTKSINRKLKTLAELGFFDVIEVPLTRGGRPVRKFILQYIHEEDFETQDQRELHERAMGHRNSRTRSTKAMLQYLRQSEVQLVSYITKGRSLTDSLYTGCFDRCMRFTTSDKVPGNRITSKLRIKKTDVLVQATTQTGLNSQLAALPDQRVIRAIITEVAHFIDSEVDRYVLEYGGPKQVSLFDGDDGEGQVGSSGIFEVDASGDPGTSDQSFESRFDQKKAEIEQFAIDRIRNDFFIDTVNLGRRLEYKSPSSSSTRRTINQSLRRLYDTNFRMMIKSASHREAVEVMRLFGLSDLVSDFRFISSLKSQYDNDFISKDESVEGGLPHNAAEFFSGQLSKTDQEYAQIEQDIDPFNPDEIMRVRVWRISLDPHLFDMLLNKETRRLFTAHSHIMREHSGLAQTIYNFFSQTIGRRNRGASGKENVFFLKLADLHNIMWPTRKYFRFEEEFIELMKRYAGDAVWDTSLTINVSCMFGYQFTLMNKAPEGKKPILWIRVERDKNDYLAGDDSYYNRNIANKGALQAAT